MENELAELKVAGLYRTLKTIEKTDGRFVWINGQRLINFCSNNYLGLANHPKVIETAKSACEEFGAGAGASRLVSGNLILHEKLEAKLAAFKGREAALVFPTGFMANLGIISSLTDENDTIIIDRLNHASIIDACRLSKAKLQVYPHKDMVALEKILKRSGKFKKRLIVTDSVFSLDGDLAPLPGKVDIIMGTLSKALGSLGGFVAGSQTLIDYIKNKARSFIYTTALPPSACAAAIASLEIIEDEPEHLRRLRENIKTLTPACRQAGARRSTIPPLPEGEGKTPIMPIIIGPAEKTLEISEKLFERGIFLSAIRPPTVPKVASRLRLTINSLHTKEDHKCLASSLQALIPA